MYLNNFSVRIVGGKEQPGGYVEVGHGKTYKIMLNNHRPTRCSARVEIDGKHVGTWLIGVQGNILLERPTHDTGCFTFYELGSPEAQQAQLMAGDPNLGLIKVTFTPERRPAVWPLTSTLDSAGEWNWSCAAGNSARKLVYYGGADSVPCAAPACYATGGTGLSGLSNQTFVTVPDIDPDLSQQTVIHLRLVAKKDDEARPLTSFSTPVPPAVS